MPKEKSFLIKLSVAVILAMLAIGAVVEHAVTNNTIRTIADIHAAPSSETAGGTVVVRGRITYAKNNRFLLSDGTGTVELSTCPVWYKQVNLQEGDKAIVVGQVMKARSTDMQSDFVLSVFKIFGDRGTVEIRRAPGKPPWIGR
ncbi:MAG: hypothetical protein ACYC2Y_07370 [Armatimonadota bacterium]